MAGKPGRTAPNRIPIELHVARGTYRKDRHGLPSTAKAVEWTPTEAQLAALGVAGRAFVARMVTAYEYSPIEGEIVLAAARVCDRLAQIHQARAGAADTVWLKLDRIEQGWLRQFATLAAQLNVTR